MQMTKSIIQYKNNNELKKKEINKNICYFHKNISLCRVYKITFSLQIILL